MTQPLSPVLVAGAGPTGMAAALELSRLGIPVRLIEKRSEPSTTSRAVGVQARTLELFEQRGIGRSLLEVGNRAVKASGWGDGKRVFQLDFSHIDSKYPYLFFVSQAETEKMLREALDAQGVAIEWGTTLKAFAEPERGAGIDAVVQRGDDPVEEIECAYLISAEGAHSTVRQTLGLQFEGRSLKESYALGDFYVDSELPESEMHVFSSEHGFMGMFPMGDGRWRAIAANPISEPSKDTEPSLEELQRLYDQRSPVPATFRDLQWASWFHINSRMIHRMRVGRVFLGGDAAHIHSPAGAQGMNTGIQDMFNLGWKLAMVLRGQAQPALLDTYGEERVPVIENVLTRTEGLTNAIGQENPVFRSLYNHIVPWVTKLDLVQENSTELMSQLSLGYRDSPLSTSEGHGGHLHAGDRLPDLPVMQLNHDGSTERQPLPAALFSLLDPSAFTLLYSNVSDVARLHAEIGHSIEPWHYLLHGQQIGAAPGEEAGFARLFGTAGGLTLVRPDGYVAFKGPEGSVGKLRDFCERWLVEEALPVRPDPKAEEAAHA